MYLDYILFLFDCVDYKPPFKTGGYWNSFQDMLVESSHTRNWLLIRLEIPISNSKLGIWICSQTKIYLNSQYEFYDVLTLACKTICPDLHILWITTKYNYILGTQYKITGSATSWVTLHYPKIEWNLTSGKLGDKNITHSCNRQINIVLYSLNNFKLVNLM